MAESYSPRMGVRRWTDNGDTFTRDELDQSFANIEARAAKFGNGALASRPAPGSIGSFYLLDTTETNAALRGQLYYDTGVQWIQVHEDITALLAGKANASHSHALGDLPVAGAGEVSATKLVRADDHRLIRQRFAGEMTISAGASVPSGWLLCDGASYPTATYPDLFAFIGYTWGGSGANFNVPNFTDRVPVGKSGSKALGSYGGSATRVLTASMLPQHTHGMTHTHTINHGHSASSGADGDHSHTASSSSAGTHGHTASTGASGTHDHSASSSSAGSHTHTASTGNAGTHSHTATTGNNGGHNHTVPDIGHNELGYTHNWAYANGTGRSFSLSGAVATVDGNGGHVHSVTVSSAGDHSHSVTVNAGGTHSHTIDVASGGSHSHTVSVSDAGAHTHPVTVNAVGTHTHTVTVVSHSGNSGASSESVTDNAGVANPVLDVQNPYGAVNWIIKT